jgi:formylglycine-generating enzyme required for sulfatase activity
MADLRLPLPNGTVLQDRYRIERCLGRGGFGLTYRAADEDLGQTVVLKEYFPLPGPHEGISVVRTPETLQLTIAEDQRAEHERRVRRLLKEARVFGEVRHPFLVRVYEAFKAHQTAYLVMGFVEGPTLRRTLKDHHRLDAATVERLLEQIGGALGHLHGKGILHLDVKPDNIIQRGDTFVLIDFGEARTFDTGGPQEDPEHISLSTGGLTPAYAAIEQYVHDMARGPHTDVYALGVTGYECLTGRLPPSPVKRQMEGVALPVEALPEGRVRDLVVQALGVRPQDRPATVAAWLGLDGTGTLPYVPVITLPPPPTPKPVVKPAAKPAQPAATYRNRHGMEFVLIPAGEFWMGQGRKAEEKQVRVEKKPNFLQRMTGAPPEVEYREEAFSNEEPVHRVQITRPFYLGKYPVTQGEWQAVMGNNPSHFKGERRPVEQVTWEDAQAFIQRLNAQKGEEVYRLPTEAEWEYACRAGTTGARYGDLDRIAWYGENSGNQTHPVGEKAANAWGLHDMLGNVWEWVGDWYGRDYYQQSPSVDPPGPNNGNFRVCRGGSWRFNPGIVRAASRDFFFPALRNFNLGFRVARTVNL